MGTDQASDPRDAGVSTPFVREVPVPRQDDIAATSPAPKCADVETPPLPTQMQKPKTSELSDAELLRCWKDVLAERTRLDNPAGSADWDTTSKDPESPINVWRTLNKLNNDKIKECEAALLARLPILVATAIEQNPAIIRGVFEPLARTIHDYAVLKGQRKDVLGEFTARHLKECTESDQLIFAEALILEWQGQGEGRRLIEYHRTRLIAERVDAVPALGQIRARPGGGTAVADNGIPYTETEEFRALAREALDGRDRVAAEPAASWWQRSRTGRFLRWAREMINTEFGEYGKPRKP